MSDRKNIGMNEFTRRRAESHQARYERNRLIRKGWIIPAYAMQPQLMVKDSNGNWEPEIKVFWYVHLRHQYMAEVATPSRVSHALVSAEHDERL